MQPMKVVSALLAIGLALTACGPELRWDKAGISPVMAENDRLECRRAAAQEAFRQTAFTSDFGFIGPPFWGYRGQYDYFYRRQRLQNDQFFHESRLANFCMRNKGYVQVPISEQPTPAR